jgi:hypothetical protein
MVELTNSAWQTTKKTSIENARSCMTELWKEKIMSDWWVQYCALTNARDDIGRHRSKSIHMHLRETIARSGLLCYWASWLQSLGYKWPLKRKPHVPRRFDGSDAGAKYAFNCSKTREAQNFDGSIMICAAQLHKGKHRSTTKYDHEYTDPVAGWKVTLKRKLLQNLKPTGANKC